MNLKTPLLIHLLGDPTARRVLVFTRTKRDANRVSDSLNDAGIEAAAIHGNKSQGARERALAGIKSGETRVLVATDIAARGIDIDEVTHVYNYDIPNIPETYVHRIGRTARAGRAGIAVSFCAPDECAFLRDIERLIRKRPEEIQTPAGLEPEARKRGGGGGNRPAGRPSRFSRAEGRSAGARHGAARPGHSAPRPENRGPRS
jgi:ATP-dependent RNA helicase RhlE